jgi:16S rRNA (adenine1518-N6/adenine1519-N6)-dimethyltransferase
MITLKKSLGQHFLKDDDICHRIVEALRQQPFTHLLEVGPGGGALTRFLLGIPGIDFRAVELDEEKISYLENKYPAMKGRLIHQSVLDMNKPFDVPFAVVGNFPYNISTQILFKMLEWRGEVQQVIGMFQKEVAQRVAAKPGSKVYGVSSVLLQAFHTVDYLFEVDEHAFDPPPKVKSAVIRLLPRTDIPEMKSERAFFNLVKTAFNQRRKTLRNGLKGLLDATALQDPIFDKRAEQISVEEFARLSFLIK